VNASKDSGKLECMSGLCSYTQTSLNESKALAWSRYLWHRPQVSRTPHSFAHSIAKVVQQAVPRPAKAAVLSSASNRTDSIHLTSRYRIHTHPHPHTHTHTHTQPAEGSGR
jgi:hypothetical protein